ncbi:MAG: hypothetical protein HY512_04045 [Candidatus Aenigmarchaeota archaeon]|nr:hypothetical protein [Candidatus Aenigmarchaeota archaeon]
MDKLFGIRDSEGELYFHLEKTPEGVSVISKIDYALFKDQSYNFDEKWQGRLPEKETYEGYEEGGVYMGVLVSKERIHIIIRGLKSSEKRKQIKDLIGSKYKLIEPIEIKK